MSDYQPNQGTPLDWLEEEVRLWCLEHPHVTISVGLLALLGTIFALTRIF